MTGADEFREPLPDDLAKPRRVRNDAAGIVVGGAMLALTLGLLIYALVTL